MNYKAICFDLFDTLIGFDENIYRLYHDQIALHLELSKTEFILAWKRTESDAFSGVFPTTFMRCKSVLERLDISSIQKLSLFYNLELQAMKKSVKNVEGIKQLLLLLSKKRIKLGLISNASCAGPDIITASGLASFFLEMVFSFAEGVRKPDPLIYQLATDRLKVKPEETVFIGDGASNELDGARKAGLRAIQFDPYGIHTDSPVLPGIQSCNDTSKLCSILEC